MKKLRILKSIVKVHTNIKKVRKYKKDRSEYIKQAVYDAFFENSQKNTKKTTI